MTKKGAACVEVAMNRYLAQSVLFDSLPRRVNLLNLGLEAPPVGSVETVVNVWRNHSFEPLQRLVSEYSAFRSWSLIFHLSSYDDSFSFNGIRPAGVELLWMDCEKALNRLSFEEWHEWFLERISVLRQYSSAPIVVATWFKTPAHSKLFRNSLQRYVAVYFADMAEVCRDFNVPLIDERLVNVAGTPLSGHAQVLLARSLTCKWLAGVALPPIKAIAVDLDDTLHDGVLGEDGIEGIKLTDLHKQFQCCLKKLRDQGIFLCLVSRNEFNDVKNLFMQRLDYPLKWLDFSAVEISWGSKVEALKRIAQALRISTDSILFIDDNPGELANINYQCPKVQTLYAGPSVKVTSLAVDYYAGLWRWEREAENSKRIIDLKASTERDALARLHTDHVEYLSSLNVTLEYFWDSAPQIVRLWELSQKTNQFNLSLRRYTQAELAEHVKCNDSCVGAVKLSDRLSDSGIIALIVAERTGDQLKVMELCISCRAMGRFLEDNIVLHCLQQMPIWRGCKKVKFVVQHGDRNKPALDWLSSLFAKCSVEKSTGEPWVLDAEALNNQISTEGIVVKMRKEVS